MSLQQPVQLLKNTYNKYFNKNIEKKEEVEIKEEKETREKQEQASEEQEEQIEDESEIEELLFSGGAGALPFLAGYIHAMVKIIGKERLRQFKIGGVSSGAIMCSYLFFILQQDKYDMKYFFDTMLRKPYQPDNKKYFGFLTNGKIFRQAAAQYFKLADELQTPDPKGTLHYQTTVIGKYGIPQHKLITDITDVEDLGDAICSSCNIPYLITDSFFTTHRGQKTLDGGISGAVPYRYENSKKIFINILPKFTMWLPWRRPKNCTTVHITKDTSISFPIDFWIWSEQWAEEMFLKGILAANNQAEELQRVFGVKTQQQQQK